MAHHVLSSLGSLWTLVVVVHRLASVICLLLIYGILFQCSLCDACFKKLMYNESWNSSRSFMIGRKNCHAFVTILAGQRSKSFKIVDDGFLSPLRHHLSTYVKPMFPLIFIHTCKKMGLPSPHQLCICCLTRMQGGNQIFLIECCAARATKWPRSPYTY